MKPIPSRQKLELSEHALNVIQVSLDTRVRICEQFADDMEHQIASLQGTKRSYATEMRAYWQAEHLRAARAVEEFAAARRDA